VIDQESHCSEELQANGTNSLTGSNKMPLLMLVPAKVV
jgi:hypothetical protein